MRAAGSIDCWPKAMSRAPQPRRRRPRSHRRRFATPLPRGLIGRIGIERLGVSVIVIEGSTPSILRRAAGHIEGTALPGQPGNVGISAHRDTFFRPLRNIRKNDVITITSPSGEYRYRVVSTQVVNPRDIEVLAAAEDPDPDAGDVLSVLLRWSRAQTIHRSRGPFHVEEPAFHDPTVIVKLLQQRSLRLSAKTAALPLLARRAIARIWAIDLVPLLPRASGWSCEWISVDEVPARPTA